MMRDKQFQEILMGVKRAKNYLDFVRTCDKVKKYDLTLMVLSCKPFFIVSNSLEL